MLLRSGRNLLDQLPSKPVQPSKVIQKEDNYKYYEIIIPQFRQYLEPFKNPAVLPDFLIRIITFRQIFTLMYENFDYIMSREDSVGFTKIVREKIIHWNEQIPKVLMNQFINDKDFNEIKIREEMKRIMPIVENLTKMFEIV